MALLVQQGGELAIRRCVWELGSREFSGLCPRGLVISVRRFQRKQFYPWLPVRLGANIILPEHTPMRNRVRNTSTNLSLALGLSLALNCAAFAVTTHAIGESFMLQDVAEAILRLPAELTRRFLPSYSFSQFVVIGVVSVILYTVMFWAILGAVRGGER